MIRNGLALLCGLAVGSALNQLIIQINTGLLFPMPAGSDMHDLNQLNRYLSTLPAAAFLVTIIGHLTQSFVGAWVAARAAASRPMVLALIIGLLSLAAGIMAMSLFEGPSWMAIELPLYLLVAWLAGRMEQRRRSIPSIQNAGEE
jgi:hypothetical protein